MTAATNVYVAQKPARLTMKGIAKLIDVPLTQWEGNCFAIASKLAPIVGGTAVYGHWLGDISPKATFWKSKRGLGMCQHGWIVLPNERGRYVPEEERIIDPTRWSFEAKKPYLWKGKNDGTYDEGGNRFRSAMASQHSRVDDPDHNKEPVLFELQSEEMYDLVKRLCRMGGFDEFSDEYPYLDHCDAMRLCNVPPKTIGWFFVAEIFEKLARAGYRAYIPTDNWKMVDRYFGISDGREED